MDHRAFLMRLFQSAVQAADPDLAIRTHLPAAPKGRTIVVGAGKASAQMARALETHWPHPLEGTVVTRYGHGVPCDRIEVLEAAHPVPDAAGLVASARLMERVKGLTADDLVIALISGGGSALLPAPPDGCTLDDDVALNRALLASGAPISVMNALRRQFSTIKGGRLAEAAWPARVVTLVVSDVPGDNPADVASGPTILDAMTPAEALALAKLYRIDLPEPVRDHLAKNPLPAGRIAEGSEVHVIASAARSLQAAAAMAKAEGIAAVILSDAIEGEAREAGAFHAALALETCHRNHLFPRPVVILSGGETTVTLRGTGQGGRNTEFLLSFAHRIAGAATVHALAADTDGIDGTGENAGAFADGTTALRLLAKGKGALAHLAENDSATAFASLGDLFTPGPTGTNVNDFRAILIIER